jgi:anti-anti-sigma factor
MPRRNRISGLARSSGLAKEEQMSVSEPLPDYSDGAIRVVPERDEIVALCLEGDFDLRNASALDNQIHQVLDGGSDLILDLSEATFIDSSIVHVVVRASRAAGRRERAMVMQVGTAAIVERVLELARIERVLPRAHDREEALRMIKLNAGAFSSD